MEEEKKRTIDKVDLPPLEDQINNNNQKDESTTTTSSTSSSSSSSRTPWNGGTKKKSKFTSRVDKKELSSKGEEMRIKNRELAQKLTEEATERYNTHCAKVYQDNKELIDTTLASEKRQKTPIVLLFSYVGTGYYGSEYNIDIKYKALENDLEYALFLSGMILPTNFGSIYRIKLSRSSRTDKGVHSMSTLIAANLEVSREKMATSQGIQEYCNLINSHLPTNLRIITMDSTARSFDPRHQCISRTYHYIVPKQVIGTKYTIQQINQDILPNFIGNLSFHNFTTKRNTYIQSNNNNKKNQQQDEDFEIDEEEEQEESKDEELKQEELKEEELKLKLMERRKKEKELYRTNSLNCRNMISFQASEIEMVYKKDQDSDQVVREEWIKFELHGASFMQYQIRKMMGFVLAITNGYSDTNQLVMALKGPFSISVPLAPPNPLYLYDCALKQRVVQSVETQSYDAFPVTSKQSIQESKVQFCHDVLYPHLAHSNFTTPFFDGFMNTILPRHIFGTENEDHDFLMNLLNDFIKEKEERKNKFKQQNNN